MKTPDWAKMLALPKPALTIDKLTPDQQKALQECLQAVLDRRWHVLRGPAGTGKTSLLPFLIPQLPETTIDAETNEERPFRLCAVAPTHKALAVLHEKLGPLVSDNQCMTLQRLLRLNIDWDHPAETEKFVPDPQEPPKYDLIIIDEASMVGEELLELCHQCFANTAILFVGDNCQLPPINEKLSQVFRIPSQSKLYKIVRQAEGNPIINAATNMRTAQVVEEDDWSWTIRNINPETLDGIYTPRPEAVDALLADAFLHPKFQQDANFARCISYRNKVVAAYNDKIRRMIYRDAADQALFLPGEILLTKRPISLEYKIVIHNNVELPVKYVLQGTHTWEFKSVYRNRALILDAWQIEFPVWWITLPLTLTQGYVQQATLPMPAREAYPILNKARQRARREANIAPQRWHELRIMRLAMIDAQHIYALTTHKAQGSTFTNVFVDVPDLRIARNTSLLYMQQLAYTAITRAARKVIRIPFPIFLKRPSSVLA